MPLAESSEIVKQVSIVFAIWFITFLQCGILKAMGILLPLMPDQYGRNASTIASIVSFMKLSGNIIGIIVMPLTKVVEVRKLIVVCGILASAGLIVSSAALKIPVLFMGMFLTGFTCVGDMLAIAQISFYFTANYKTATNIITTALPVATMTFALLTQVLADIYGSRGTMLLLAGIHFHFVAGAMLLKPLKDNIGRRTKDLSVIKEKSSSKCCGAVFEDKNIFYDMFDASLLHNSSFVLLLIVRLMSGYVNNGWIMYLYSIAEYKGLQPYPASTIPFVCGLGLLISRVILGLYPRVLSTRNLLYVGCALEAISFLGLIFATSFLDLSLVSLILGLGDGIMGSQIFIAVNSVVDKTKIVSAIVYIQLVHGIGFEIGGYLTGRLSEWTGDFSLSLVCLCAAATSAIITLGAEDAWNMRKDVCKTNRFIK